MLRERADRRRDVEPAPPGVGVAAVGARAAGVRRQVDGRRLEDLRDLLRPKRGMQAQEHRGSGAHLRRRERGPLRLAILLGPAARVPLLAARREASRERPGKDREDVQARRGDVVVDPVAVRERRDPARVGRRADPENVRQRCRVARVVPRARRCLVRVPDGSDHDDAVRDGVGDGVRLEPRVRVAVGVERIAETAEAHVDDARSVVDRPADGASLRLDRNRARLRHHLRDRGAGPRGRGRRSRRRCRHPHR